MKTTKMRAKFQEICLRVRHWLIRKLGGYTEQRVSPSERVYMPPPMSMQIEQVVWHARVHMGYGLTPDEEKKYMASLREEALYNCMRQIIDKKLYVLTCEPDRAGSFYDVPGGRIYTVSLSLVTPNDWMRTSFGDCLAPEKLERRTVLYQRKCEDQASHP